VISLIIPQQDGEILIASEQGFGKRSRLEDYSVIGRGGQGVIGMKLNERNGSVVGAIQMFEGDEVILISDQGTLVRTRGEEVSVQGRNTQGVRLINVGSEEHLVGLARVEEPDEVIFDADADLDDALENDLDNDAEKTVDAEDGTTSSSDTDSASDSSASDTPDSQE
jgi:DNA gyrase subunit A